MKMRSLVLTVTPLGPSEHVWLEASVDHMRSLL